MIAAIQAAFLLLLYLLAYMMIGSGLRALLRRSRARARLEYVHRARWTSRLSELLARHNRLNRHLSDILEVISSKLTPGMLLFVSAVAGMAGFLAGGWFFHGIKGAFASALIAGGMPYLLCRVRWMNLRLRTRLEFLPAAEIFYQVYLLNGGRNIRNTLQLVLTDRRLMYPIGHVFEQLHRNLATGREAEEALRLFSYTLGHVWADYFSGIVRIGLAEGLDISGPLQELIADMRKAQRADQTDRNRLLEIRIANYTPLGFLALFLFINTRINPEQAYYFYIVDPVGRNLLLDALILIFASFLMGLYLSVRRM